ncbi:MAG: endo alpha-1,4 polygalactosaminidase [Actinomycetes bacterium]
MLIALLAVAACGSTATPAADPSPTLPPTEGVFDYQLGVASDHLSDGTPIDLVVRDAAADPLEGAYSVCYVNGFQTQPGSDWSSRPEAMLRDTSGEPVRDPDWPDEIVLDPTTDTARTSILEVITPIIEGCAEDGFDAVEIDNLDTWTRFDQIDEAGAHELARAYVDLAHGAGLAIAQKNAAEITQVAKDELGFDFAVTEECGVWSECAAYTDVYGDHVLQIEYPEALEKEGLTFADVCALDDRAPLTILRDVELVAAGEDGYVYDAC